MGYITVSWLLVQRISGILMCLVMAFNDRSFALKSLNAHNIPQIYATLKEIR